MNRNYKMDNIKSLLIFFVVFGHFLELALGWKQNQLVYTLIYSFHMPVFIFISGYFSKFNPEKIVRNMIYPYLLFQVLYLLFDKHILLNESFMQFTQPYWILWYLLGMIFWNLLIPFIDTDSTKKMIRNIAIAFLLSILVGMDKTVGYYISLSRILVFFPFFLMGYYMKNSPLSLEKSMKSTFFKRFHIPIRIGALFLVVVSVLYCYYNNKWLRPNWFYGADSYIATESTFYIRILFFVIAVFWILFFLLFIPNIKIPIVSNIGKNTMPIYLIHGFILRYIGKKQWVEQITHKDFIFFIATVGILLFFSNKYVVKVLSPFLHLKKIERKKRNKKETRKKVLKDNFMDENPMKNT